MDITNGNSFKEKEIGDLFSLKKKILINKYHKISKQNIQNNILKDLTVAADNLKTIYAIEAISDIEYEIYKTTSLPAFLWQEKIINNYDFFCTILGAIDSNLDNLKERINFKLHFVDLNHINIDTEKTNELYELQNEQKEFLTHRELIISNYKNFDTNSSPKIVKDAILNYPSHQYFNECFKDFSENSNQLKLQIEFINAYIKGYTTNNRIDFNIIFEKYKELYYELINYKHNIKANYEKQKIKKLRKK